MPSRRRASGAWRKWAPLLLLALGGCGLRHHDEEISPLDQAINDAEALFSRRAVSAAELDKCIEAWRTALSMSASDPRVLAGLARAYTARAYGYGLPDPAGDYEIAKVYAWSCMMQDPGFSARVIAEGGRLTERAARLLGERFRPCLEGYVVAGLRWVEVRGPAAALDLSMLNTLAHRADEPGTAASPWIGPWAIAMVIALTPDPKLRDVTAMETEFARAEAALPELWMMTADHMSYAPILDEARWMALMDRRPSGDWELENSAALARLKGLKH